MRNKSAIEKLNEEGYWNGPHGFLIKKMIRADQILGSRGFMGIFQKDAFKGVPGFKDSPLNMYIGRPGKLWQLRINIDKVRDQNGKLKVVTCEDDTKEEMIEAHLKLPKSELPRRERKPKAHAMTVKASPEQLVVYPLDHCLQAPIVEPSSFAGYRVQINGMTPVGLEIATQITKMGLHTLSMYEPNPAKPTDICSSRYRVFDPLRSRLVAAQEIIADGSLCQIVECFPKYIDGAEEFGNIVINAATAPAVRKATWELVKANGKVSLYMDAQACGLRGRVFAFSPKDDDSVQTYEMDLQTATDKTMGETVYMTGLVGSFAVMLFSRWIGTPDNAKNAVIDKMFVFDADVLAQDGALLRSA